MGGDGILDSRESVIDGGRLNLENQVFKGFPGFRLRKTLSRDLPQNILGLV